MKLLEVIRKKLEETPQALNNVSGTGIASNKVLSLGLVCMFFLSRV